MFRLIMRTAGSLRSAFDRAPSNHLARSLRTHARLRSALAALSIGAAYLLAAVVCTVLLGRGAPGWLNLPVLLFLWNAWKLVLTGLYISFTVIRQRLARPSRHEPLVPDDVATGRVVHLPPR